MMTLGRSNPIGETDFERPAPHERKTSTKAAGLRIISVGPSSYRRAMRSGRPPRENSERRPTGWRVAAVVHIDVVIVSSV